MATLQLPESQNVEFNETVMTNVSLNIETTADGSVTVYRDDLDEHYHSVKGALAESRHVYLNLGWRKCADRHARVRVFEVGFGTGLNAALTAKAALEAGVMTDYHSIELYPITAELSDVLLRMQSSEYYGEYRDVNSAEWGKGIEINSCFVLHKIKGNLLTAVVPEGINVVYFDAFAPEKQPEMWSEAVFRKLYDAMVPGGILTTYCAKGVIRRLLEQTGFVTERLAGPPEGKREVLRATKPD